MLWPNTGRPCGSGPVLSPFEQYDAFPDISLSQLDNLGQGVIVCRNIEALTAEILQIVMSEGLEFCNIQKAVEKRADWLQPTGERPHGRRKGKDYRLNRERPSKCPGMRMKRD